MKKRKDGEKKEVHSAIPAAHEMILIGRFLTEIILQMQNTK